MCCVVFLVFLLMLNTVCMAEWLDGHLGSSRSRVETLLELALVVEAGQHTGALVQIPMLTHISPLPFL